MATTTRAITPTHTGPFAVPNGPTTPGAGARNSHGAPTFGTHLTNSPRGLSPRHSPQPVPGAMSLSDERQYRQSTPRQMSPHPVTTTSPNVQPPNSTQLPAPTSAASESMPKPAIVIPAQTGVTGENMQTSPVSLSSFGDDAPGAPAAAGDLEASVGPKNGLSQETVSQQPQHQQNHHQLIAPNPGDNPGNRAFTFPGPLPPEPDPRAPARQMSLPGYGQNTPKSPSTKRHKCPYCSTDFTRHHNLKSHLLTHSQEKPYECPTCQARFRRLHDLKRHTKLHTGERPHTCFKCGRRFARGDALARHNKGQGGCAGRRSSFGMDDELAEGKDGDMDGVVYTGEHDGDGDEDDDGGRRVSEPARKRQNTGSSAQGSYHQHSSTYPPIAANRGSVSQNNLRPYYPATSSQATNISPKLAPSSISSLQNAGQSNVFAQGGMTESPKPLSPRQQEQHRLGTRDNSLPGSRSPNMSHHILHQGLARGAGRGTPPMALAPPNANNGPHLPSLPGLNPLASKQGSQSGKSNGPSLLQHQAMAAPPSTASQPGSISSHGGSGSSMREVIGGQVDVWQYVREMEARMARTEKEHTDMIATLQNEVTTLRAQLAQQHVNSSQAQQQGP
ncbi:hypothetical protein HBH56_071220 [Parastagonospora nodorum]|uniref:C2H2-type domain-containing protein n=1 Tax=Phaeosphaeria nodorum (strain SN15 / ATCC MYA-4574 / FGSC 10173) TaxID=321614 RepID=A0A7U2EVW1_PHANO|nr:hypothetical protein HBH56_071220 [Parastagonospora nodorum]QRC93741.1 hypothetical protein JI435_039320 [Parastagonospora nodorum SN15]KAH3954850.1 hypothetical protein HBH53_017470 [Parastagonospora nodorum]KAH3986105.1 hypothetical protein HBH52_048620 [Parastagonospora nodorum]KAH4040675.1 hypothetical protein HBI09_030970 [Parastagonospora nodorum]